MAIPSSISYMMKINWKLGSSTLEYFRKFIPLSHSPEETAKLIVELKFENVVLSSLANKQFSEIEKWLNLTIKSDKSKTDTLKELEKIYARHKEELQELTQYLEMHLELENSAEEIHMYMTQQLNENLINKYAVIKQFQIKNTVDLLLSEMRVNKAKAEWYEKVIRTKIVREKVNDYYKIPN